MFRLKPTSTFLNLYWFNRISSLHDQEHRFFFFYFWWIYGNDESIKSNYTTQKVLHTNNAVLHSWWLISLLKNCLHWCVWGRYLMSHCMKNVKSKQQFYYNSFFALSQTSFTMSWTWQKLSKHQQLSFLFLISYIIIAIIVMDNTANTKTHSFLSKFTLGQCRNVELQRLVNG